MIPGLFARFFRSVDGGMAAATAILAPVLFGVVALAVDFSMVHHHRSGLQEAADSAVLSSATELALVSSTDDQVEAIAVDYVRQNLHKRLGGSRTGLKNLAVDATVSDDRKSVSIEIAYTWQPFFAQIISDKVTPIKVSSRAHLAGEGLVCVVGLMKRNNKVNATMHFDHRSRLRADDCGLYSNAKGKWSIRADKRAQVRADSICAAGGVMNKKDRARISPQPTTDCPVIPDPLGDRNAPHVGACTYQNAVITTDTVVTDGVFCGGLTITNDAEVTFSPGVHVIKDGPLIVKEGGQLIANNAGFFLTGEQSFFQFHPESRIRITAPTEGPMAGLLFHEDRDTPHRFDFEPKHLKYVHKPGDIPSDWMEAMGVRLHRISSKDAKEFVGTFYLPNSILLIDAEAGVAEESAFTAIVVGRLWLREGPVLTLNSNYSVTDVPVPTNLIGRKPVLGY